MILSTAIASGAMPHGGPVIAMRHARALARQGARVHVVAPEVGPVPEAAGVTVERYPITDTRVPFSAWRHDARAVDALAAAIERHAPEVVYDVHGPAWAAEAASAHGVPTVSMVGDFNAYCRRTFLVDTVGRRCTGPESAGKCFACLNRESAPRQRAIRSALRNRLAAPILERIFPPARLAPHRLWDALGDSRDYAARWRERIDRFVVGDENARAFLAGHGIDAARLATIPQGLPATARTLKRRNLPGSGVPLAIGFVGRPHVDKGLHLLARAFDSLPAGKAELRIIHARYATEELVAPMFPDRGRLHGQVARGSVRFVQPADDEALHRAMAEVDVACIPSLQFESPSLALLEFVAQRTPVIRSESAGMDHVIQDGVNGRTFPYGDWRALRAALVEVIEEPALLARWSARLPEVGSDDAYAASLLALFATLRPAVSRRIHD
ncbi:MAG TPA: glycosyltransferase family 4 protein [Usitatibacter sp.]|nr:glycosyltransferase family 4 protein [Usitatibacter sp.]